MILGYDLTNGKIEVDPGNRKDILINLIKAMIWQELMKEIKLVV
jgi:hypothetical protein